LCVLYFDNNNEEVCCDECPYKMFYGFTCDDVRGHWANWTRTYRLPEAVAMKEALEKILE
jgi:hypothetical protein